MIKLNDLLHLTDEQASKAKVKFNRDNGYDDPIDIYKSKQRWTRGYKRYKETSGLIEWKECQIFHSIFT